MRFFGVAIYRFAGRPNPLSVRTIHMTMWAGLRVVRMHLDSWLTRKRIDIRTLTPGRIGPRTFKPKLLSSEVYLRWRSAPD